MKNLILSLLLLLSPFFLFAHNPLSARYYLEVGEKVSMLTINLSQTGLHQALLKQHNEADLNVMDQQEYKELIVDYIKRNFQLVVNHKSIALGKGGIKLGSHQTDLRFVLPPIPIKSNQIFVNIPAFKENDYHQTIFSYDIKGCKNKVILSQKNNYQSTINLDKKDQEEQHWLWSFLGFS